jgi:primosomal protein N' (replication factor Y) (superfamily II helicase)
MPRLISVAVPVPGLDLLTYRVPDEFDPPVRGARVLVPVGSRTVTGCVVGVEQLPESGTPVDDPDGQPIQLRDVLAVLDDEPYLADAILDLALWVAEYYLCGPGEAIAAAMPPYGSIASERRVRITAAGRDRARGDQSSGCSVADPGLLPGRAALLQALAHGRPVALRTLASRAARGDVTKATRSSPEPPPLGRASQPPLEVSLRSEASVRRIQPHLAALERLGLVETVQALRGRSEAFKSIRVAFLTAHGAACLDRGPSPRLPALGTRQHEALHLLHGAPAGLPLQVLSRRGVPADVVRRLAARGLVSVRQVRIQRDPVALSDPFFGSAGRSSSTAGQVAERSLTAEQRRVFERLTELSRRNDFRVALVHGVTGSGKTELYIRLAQSVVASGRTVLLLVPEIALTPAVASLVRRTFGSRVAVQHSALSSGERHDQWHRIRSGGIDVVVGTRSAVFAPLDRLGLLIVDEEHDPSYKQEEAPRYHARDVAVMRAKRAEAFVVLGSATPSLESYHNGLNGRYERLTLERRVQDRPLAAVRIVDMRLEYAEAGPDVILSASLREGIGDRLARGEQVLVLLNRRGYATAVFCRQCAATLECPNCSVSLTVHRASRRARCHYCNYATGVPGACTSCAAPYLEQVGFGTERVEAEVTSLFPGVRVARLDRDAVRRRGSLDALLHRFGRGDLQILVGTQMIAKGHDFPDVTLVGVISADVGLGLADFRAAERTFQLLTQVAGRAGRGEKPGEAIIQTLYPDHYSIRHACGQDYVSFYRDEMKFRQAMRYPPVVALVNAIVRARTFGAALADAAGLANRLRAVSDAYRVLGPAPAPLGRLRGEHRAQFFLKGSNRAAMRRALQALLRDQPELRRRMSIDVDPVSIL